MKFKLLPLIIILFYASSCVPSGTLIDTQQEDSLSQINKELKNKVVEIRLNDRKQIKGTEAEVTTDSLFYDNSKKDQAIALNKVHTIAASPKLGFYHILGISLFAVGIYHLNFFDSEGDIYEVMGKFYGGAMAIATSGFVLVVGHSTETEIYRFKER